MIYFCKHDFEVVDRVIKLDGTIDFANNCPIQFDGMGH